jgi:nicotinate phosphoribosyltransferase
LEYLRQLKLSIHVDAIPEGTVVFPHQPLLRLPGPIVQCQLLETALLNILDFQTLIATKASRVARVAGSDLVFEFGLRHKGPDGVCRQAGLHMSVVVPRPATCWLVDYGIPVRGTHAQLGDVL